MGKLYSTSVQIRDPKGNYLWVRRSPTAPSRAGQYEHSGGHAEPGETSREAAIRETREETGIKIREDELRLVERKTGPKGDHVTFSHVVRKATIPKLSFEHDAYVWSPEKPALTNGFLSRYMKGKDTSGMTTQEKAKKAAIGVATTAVTRTAGKAIAKKLAAQAATRVAVKAGTAGTGVGVFVTGGMMVADAAPEAWAVTKETLAVPGQISRKVREAKGLGGKLRAAASGSGKAFVDLNMAPLRVGAASIFGSGTVKMAREAAGEAMAARKAKQMEALQNGVGAVLLRRGAQAVAQKAGKAVVQKGGKAVAQKGVLGGLRSAARQAPKFTAAVGSIMKEAGKVVGIGAGVVGVSALAVQGVAGQIRGRTADKQAPSPAANKNPSSVAANVAEINKMLKNMPSDWQAQLSINRAELKAAGADSSQLPPASPNAHNILLSLNLNNRGEVSSEAAAGQEPTSGQTVPDDVRDAAMEGVRLSYQNNYGGYHMIGLARAIQLAVSPKISNAALNRMRMYFDRKTKQDRLSDQYANKHGKRYWSWLNWGGDPGARWSGSKRFAELVKENPRRYGGLPVRQNFLFKSDPEAVDAAKRQQLIAAFSAAHPSLPGVQVRTIVRAPAKPGMFSKKLNPALYLVGPVVSERMLTDTSDTGSPTSYYEDTSAWILPHVFGAWNAATKHNTKVYAADVYTGQVREFNNITDFEAAVNQARGNWKVLMARSNPYYNPYHKKEIGPQGTVCFYIYNDDGSKVVGPTGPKYCYSLDKAEDFVRKAERAGHRVSPSDVSPGPRIAQKATAERRAPVSGPMQYIEDRFELLRPILNQHLVMSVEQPHRDGVGSRGKARTVQGIQPRTIYAVIHTGLRADGTVRPSFVVNMATMEISRADAEGRPREAWNYGTIDEVIARGKTLKPRNNPAAYTLVGDGHGVRLRDLVREGQGAELHESTKAKKSQGAQARGKKAKAKSKRNPSPGFTTEEWLADVEGEEWANYDLNRAGIMHYSGSGIPTYPSLYR